MVIYRSSAGSGKTYTLAKEYVKLLIQNPRQHPHILAVTFTNKATQEMKARIVDFLKELTELENEDLANQLASETGKTTHYIMSQATVALGQILHDYSNFTVLTIDSFFNRVVKAFARELGLPLQMDLQLDTETTLNDAYEKVMGELTGNPELQKWLTAFMLNKLENDKGWNIEWEIKALGKELFKEGFKQIEEEVFAGTIEAVKELLTELRKVQNSITRHLNEFGKQGVELMEQHGLNPTDFAYGKSSFAQHFAKLSIFSGGQLSVGARVLQAHNNLEKWYSKKAKEDIVARIESIYEQLNELLGDSLQYWEEQKKAFISAELVAKNLYTLGILKVIESKLREYRDENDLVLISDQNQFINQVIQDAGLEFMYHKTGSKYFHYLIDEFQDTSAVQWENFRPLLENTLSEGNRALVVGDAKQSIYRWRGGEMQLLLNQVTEDLGFEPEKVVKNLNANYRSHENIIAFNNAFFDDIASFVATQDKGMASPLLEMAYADVHQKTTSRTKKGGFVRLDVFNKEKNEELSARERLESHLLEEISALFEEGFSPGEIALLVSTNLEGSRLAEILNAANIPVQSSESLMLSQSQVVQFIVACFHFFVHPHDELHRAALLSHLFQLGHINSPPHEELKNCRTLDLDSYLKLFPDSFAELVNQQNSPNIISMLNAIVVSFELESNDSAYVQSLGEVILDFQAKSDSSLENFLEWWAEFNHKLSIQIPAGDNAVVIQTVHKSKGLQYPVVIMPYLSRSIAPKSGQVVWVASETEPYEPYGYLPIELKKEMADSHFSDVYLQECEQTIVDAVNGLYVGFTRAEQRLYLMVDLGYTQSSIGKWIEPRFQQLDGTEDLGSGSFTFGSTEHAVFKPIKDRIESLTKTRVNAKGAELHLRKTTLTVEDLETTKQLQRVKGAILHGMLSEINHQDDIEEVVQLALFSGTISSDDKPEYVKHLKSVFTIKGIEKVFDQEAEVLAERDILTPNGFLRPDRLLIKGDTALVVDFKTGEARNRDIKQLQEYIDILRTEMPNHKVSGVLVYTQKRKLVQLG